MQKLVFGLNRPDDTDFEAFREYWLEEHAPIAAELPGLRRYTVSFPDDPDRSQYDGLAELWFDDRAALDAALASEAGEATATDLANFAGDDDMLQLVVEEHVVVE
ncbi:EthD family reductase [Halomarina litorea]|uniref:EthD family reductase n=1 Tax=Halomarina litorea TaxID=2961595 RepID=UPI0020C32D5F|nr:EthD family reductase [Halomarina sp. BCD28]